MALFQKKPQTGNTAPLYTLGLNKSVLLVGLGNVGKEYDRTRHNIGFECINDVVERLELSNWIEKKDQKCFVSSGVISDTKVIAIKPTTFMNLSGEAVSAVQHFYKIPSNQMLVLHDDIDIDFGQIRTRMGGSDAGNNGIKSLITHCSANFGRVRIGVKNPTLAKMDSADFVLGKFSKPESQDLPALIKEVSVIVTEYLYGGGELPSETRNFLA